MFDKENKMKHILEELKNTDAFYRLFKEEFSELLYMVIGKFYPSVIPNPAIDDLLQTYALEILSSTETVIDKDRNYPVYRLDEELVIMNRLILKLPEAEQFDEFRDAIHNKAKELMVKHYEGIVDLSSNGFRLLEKNAKLYNWEFISNFYSVTIPRNSYYQTLNQ